MTRRNPLHGDILIDCIRGFGRGDQRIVEIGVYKGRLLKMLLKNCSDFISEYWAVDPWKLLGDASNTYLQDTIRDSEGWEQTYLHICGLMRYYPQVKVMRTLSVEAAKLFSVGYFDLVFIDGHHSYDAVKMDIDAWLPLVKRGGILAGHDYENRVNPNNKVKEAVDDYFGEGNFELCPEFVWLLRIKG